MKHIPLVFLMIVGLEAAQAQGWGSIVTTTFDASIFSKAKDFANKDGIHVLLTGSSSVKYVLLNSSGGVVRQATLESVGGDFPNITGDNSAVMAVYLKGSTIKAWRSSDAGSTWNDGGTSGIPDITFSDSYCSGVDALKDDRGLHVAYATRPSSSGTWETYYQRYESGTSWVGYKNVTDFTPDEVGGFPSITTSQTKVHVSYNTTSYSDQDLHSGYVKTRDYNFTSQLWEDPQSVVNYPDFSVQERAYVTGTTLHLLYVTLVESMGEFVPYLYDTKRSVSGTTWSTPVYIQNYADRARTASSTNGKLHIVYRSSGLQYRNYDGSNWSTSQSLTSDGPIFHYVCSNSNDLYLAYRGGVSSYLKFCQNNAAPIAPQSLQMGTFHDVNGYHPRLTWAANTEPDLASYKIYRGFGINGGYGYLATVSQPTTYYNDLSLNLGNGDTAYYKITAVDAGSLESGYSNSVWVVTNMQHVRYDGPEPTPNIAPGSFALESCYPNPFNPATRMRYQLATDAYVTLVVYDVLGRQIRTIENGQKQAGYYEATVDGSQLASGVYFARLVAIDASGSVRFAGVNKLVLVK